MIVPTRKNIAVIGLGSPNGDDQIGWQVVDRLASMGFDSVQFQKINNAIDVLPFLETSDHVHLVDAAVGMPSKTLFRKLSYSDPQERKLIQEVPTPDTHDIGPYLILRLAESLEKPTEHVTLWIGNGSTFGRREEMSETGQHAADACVGALIVELCDARDVIY